VTKSNQPQKILIENRFHLTLRILSREICKQCLWILWVKSWKIKAQDWNDC